MRVEQFESLIQDDLSWRKKEISDLFFLVQNSNQEEILLKSLILILYAHWEGYIKKASKVYLKYISNKNIKISNLTVNFKAIYLKNLSRACIEIEESLSLGKEIEFINKYNSIENKKFNVSINLDNDQERSIVETGHNLKPSVLKNIFKLIGLEYLEPLESREQYLSIYLLNNRNSISHGSNYIDEMKRDYTVNFEEVKRLKEVIVIILDCFKDMLLDYQNFEYYLEINKEIKNTYNQEKGIGLKRALQSIDGTV